MSEAPPLTIAICTYKRPADVDALLGDLFAQIDAAPDLDILVLDNADDAATADVVARRVNELPGLRRVVEPKAGLSRARNAAASNTTARHIWFLDDDVRLRPGFLAAVRDVLAKHDPDLAGGPIDPLYDQPPPPGIDPDYFFRRKRAQSGWWASGSLSGGNFAVKRVVFDRIGAFRTDLGMIGASMGFLEELEFALRYRASPDRDPRGLYYACECVVAHRVPADKAQLGYLARRQWKSHRQLGAYYARLAADRRGALLACAWARATAGSLAHLARSVAAAFKGDARAWSTWTLASAGRVGFALGALSPERADVAAKAGGSRPNGALTAPPGTATPEAMAALAETTDLWAFGEIAFDARPPLKTLSFLTLAYPACRPIVRAGQPQGAASVLASRLGLAAWRPEPSAPAGCHAGRDPISKPAGPAPASASPLPALSAAAPAFNRAVGISDVSGFEAEVHKRAERAAVSAAYRAYLRVRRAIFSMMDDWTASADGGPSAYWREEIDGFLYLFDASPLIVETLREQCYHITGIKSYEYRSHHDHKAKDFVGKHAMLAALDATGVFVPEPKALGGFGFPVKGGGLVNIDTLKFYEVLIGLERAGMLKDFRGAQGPRKLVVEIGSGWGGFAYQFKTLCPRTTYVCVDLPPTMLFSGTYLQAMFPDAKTLFWSEDGFAEKFKNLHDYDFVFLPHYAFDALKGQGIDLGLNMVSFQEMTSGQVEGYVQGLKAMGCPRLYSLNRDRSKHNKELSTVGEILRRHYKVETVPVLDLPYTHLKHDKTTARKPELGVHDYRHYAATQQD